MICMRLAWLLLSMSSVALGMEQPAYELLHEEKVTINGRKQTMIRHIEEGQRKYKGSQSLLSCTTSVPGFSFTPVFRITQFSPEFRFQRVGNVIDLVDQKDLDNVRQGFWAYTSHNGSRYRLTAPDVYDYRLAGLIIASERFDRRKAITHLHAQRRAKRVAKAKPAIDKETANAMRIHQEEKARAQAAQRAANTACCLPLLRSSE